MPTLFDLIDKKDYEYTSNLYIEKISPTKKINIFYSHVIDGFAHKYGIDSIEFNKALNRIDKEIGSISKDSNVIVFSDHGMSKITKRVNIKKILEDAGYVNGDDFVCFFDSTMFRIWFIDKNIKEEISNIIQKIPNSIILTDAQKKKYGLRFKGNKYGEIIGVMDNGVEIFPNSFNSIFPTWVKAMHGYLPECEDSNGVFLSNCIKTKKNIMEMIDILPTICTFLDLKIPETCQGKSIQ